MKDLSHKNNKRTKHKPGRALEDLKAQSPYDSLLSRLLDYGVYNFGGHRFLPIPGRRFGGPKKPFLTPGRSLGGPKKVLSRTRPQLRRSTEGPSPHPDSPPSTPVRFPLGTMGGPWLFPVAVDVRLEY